MLDKMSREIDEAQSDTSKLAQSGDELGIDAGIPGAGQAQQADPPSPPPPPARPRPTPRLPVVRLAPDGTEETSGQSEEAPRLSLTNASLGRQPPPHPRASRVSAAPDRAKPVSDPAPARSTYPGPGDPPAAPRQATPQPRPPDARPTTDDEDDEHIVPVDEDNEHLVGSDPK